MQRNQRRLWYWLAGLAVLGCMAGGAYVAWTMLRDRPAGYTLEMVYDGPSTELRRTVILPTLDTPLPDATSAVWCASFQLAWDELVGLSGAPIQVTGQEELARRLNAGRFSPTDLTPGSYYAAAGFTRDGIVDRIRTDMVRLFPDVRVPDFGRGNAAIAFAYLRASVPFRLPYYEYRFTFKDSGGSKTTVRAFGLGEQQEGGAEDIRSQVEILFVSGGNSSLPTEFALDLCRDSSPDQVVVARIPRGHTLGETVAAVEERTRQARAGGRTDTLDRMDQLLVPAMSWRVEHRYRELEGPARLLVGGRLDGLYISHASQVIQFRLDKGGADLASKARIEVKSGPRWFRCDGPFLVYLKRRGAALPYFAMWVDNAELLAPLQAQP